MNPPTHLTEQEDASFDHLNEGFQMIGFDWKYLYVNKAFVLQGKCKNKEDLLGYTMMEKYPGIEKTEMFAMLQKCMNERTPQNVINEFRFPDDSKGWFELRVQPVPKGIFIVSLDITDRIRTDNEKNEHIQGLEEMLFITSHKVRQPVTHILGVSNLLESTSPSHDDLSRIVGYMKQAAVVLDVYTRELTTFIHEMKLKARNRNWV